MELERQMSRKPRISRPKIEAAAAIRKLTPFTALPGFLARRQTNHAKSAEAVSQTHYYRSTTKAGANYGNGTSQTTKNWESLFLSDVQVVVVKKGMRKNGKKREGSGVGIVVSSRSAVRDLSDWRNWR